MLISGPRNLAALSFIVLGLSSGEAWSQSVERLPDGRISIRATDRSIDELFDELSEVVPFEVLAISPSVGRKRVSLDEEAVAPEDGIRAILEEAKVNFALSGGNGRPFRVFVDSADAEIPRGGFDSRDSEPEPEPELEPDDPSEDIEPELEEALRGDRGLEAQMEAQARVLARSESQSRGGEASTRGPVTAAPGQTGQARTTTGEAAVVPRPAPRARPRPRPRPSPRQAPRGQSGPVTGTARPGRATDGARLDSGPSPSRVAATGGILGIGLLLGVVLVGSPEDGKRRKAKRRD